MYYEILEFKRLCTEESILITVENYFTKTDVTELESKLFILRQINSKKRSLGKSTRVVFFLRWLQKEALYYYLLGLTAERNEKNSRTCKFAQHKNQWNRVFALVLPKARQPLILAVCDVNLPSFLCRFSPGQGCGMPRLQVPEYQDSHTQCNNEDCGWMQA